jgi:hypothetical protein
MISLTLISLIAWCQELITLSKRRSIMKISQGIEHFFNYQRLNVKKKYIQEL